MRVLTFTAAKYFCSRYSGATPSVEMRRLLAQNFSRLGRIDEGSRNYNLYCDNLLREAERSLVLGVSCFRRALDLLSGSGAAWSHVTLYYASWFGARALLAMHGGWIDGRERVEVTQETRGQQQFTVGRKRSFGNSHKQFWQAYYAGLRAYRQAVSPELISAVEPINGQEYWQIDTRNRLNYDSQNALDLADQFVTSFSVESFPVGLPGELSTQFHVTRATLLLAAQYAVRLEVATDALANPFGSRKTAIGRLVFDTALPELALHSERAALEV